MTIKPIELTVDGQKIRGNFYKPGKRVKGLAFIFLHGWTGKPNDWAAEFLAENGYHTLTINMRGHGDSDGDIKKVSRKNSLDDAIAAYDFLKSYVPGNVVKIGAIGNSYGAYIAVMLSAQRPLACLSIRVPAAYIDEGFTKTQWGQGSANPKTMEWRESAVRYSNNEGFGALHAFAGPVQILEAEHDDAIPKQTVKNYINAIASPKQLEYRLLKGWPHSMGDDEKRNQELQGILLDWIKNRVEKV